MIDLITLNILYDNDYNLYEIKKLIDNKCSLFLKVSFGSILPVLKKLSANGMLNVEKQLSAGGKKRSIYSITQKGKEHFHKLIADDLPENPPTAEQIISIKLISLLRESDFNKIQIINDIIKHYELSKINAEKILKAKVANDVGFETLINGYIRYYEEKIRILTNLINKIKI
jgi:DNA-binding PadR family transcriptional regulator